VTTKREREYAKRRAQKWDQHRAELEAKSLMRRRLAIVAMIVLVAASVTWIAVAAVRATSTDDPEVQDSASTTTAADAETDNSAQAPDPAIAQDRIWTVNLNTSVGEIELALDGHAAPQAVASFVDLAQQGFFDDTVCHRLTTGSIYVLQCGDPTGTGTGGPDYRFGPVENAPSDNTYPAGTVAMARVGNDAYSMGSQFFLVYADSQIPADSGGGYTVFGEVTSGMDVLQEVADAGVLEGTETPALQVTIEKVDAQ
jgi:peptidyl-prolyl cis-trans isomerase B (cyclophilin B)